MELAPSMNEVSNHVASLDAPSRAETAQSTARRCSWFLGMALTAVGWLCQAGRAQETPSGPLPGTAPLTMEGDIASQMVDGIDRFLLRELEASVAKRREYWRPDISTAATYRSSVAENRRRLAHIVGLRDSRVVNSEPQFVATPSQTSLAGRGADFEIHRIRWPAFGDVHGEGLLLIPTGTTIVANIVAIPDCGVLPEQLVGLLPGVPAESQYARRLAENGCRVVVPLLVNRSEKLPNLSHREWLYRSAYELGRGLIGYEVQQVLAAVDWFASSSVDEAQIGVIGWGEGGLLALYAGALDERILVTGTSGYFGSRQSIWREPLDRNVFGLLERFGDAELASLVAPRALVVEACKAAEAEFPGGRGAPARVVTPALEEVQAEVERARRLTAGLQPAPSIELVSSGDGTGLNGTSMALTKFLRALGHLHELKPLGNPPEILHRDFDVDARHARHLHELNRHSQEVLRESPYVREAQTLSRLDFSSLAAYERSTQVLREEFHNQVIGRFSLPPLPFQPRSRAVRETAGWIGYEVVLDVFPDVFAYGLLLVPKHISPGEKRPVVVCQHGLEGRPQDTIGDPTAEPYAGFSARLAERGFVVFAPQNPYIFEDRFRTLQRKAYPLGRTLFSIITPQHQQIVDWLQTLEFVDPSRIGFYGLSYGGKTAMRVPAIVTDYCLSICSADFNEWVDKNASTRNPRTYANMGEYEIFEFDLGSTFNYAEMAALIAPRPFMVERGHFDGVADDWTVASEYAKVRFLYSAELKLPERTEIEFFDGPHAIHGDGTFRFLHHHLRWPEPSSR